MSTSNEAADAFFAAQKTFQEHFGIAECLMETVEDYRACRWEDPKRGLMGGCIQVQHEAIQKNGLTLYLGENNGNHSWVVFDDKKRVENPDDFEGAG